MVDLNEIQTLVDEAAKEESPTIDFPIPKGCDATGQEWMEVKESALGGKGFFARKDISAGTMLLAAKPLALIMDWSIQDNDDEDDISMDDDDDDVMKGSKRNGLLIINTINAMKQNPSLWFDHISKLYPRELTDDLPMWICEDAATGMVIEDTFDDLKTVAEFSKSIYDDDDDDENNISFTLVDEIQQRLPLIIRYNCLSIETGSELFVHPNQDAGGHIHCSATGLYHLPSYFNHSHVPKVSRFSIGDVMFFVANQNVKSGEELCITYIETELLCENADLRSKLLDMDFEESEIGGGSSAGTDADADADADANDTVYECTPSPIIDVMMQDELMSMHPLQRLDEIETLFASCNKSKDGGMETSEDDNDDDDDDDGMIGLDELHWFQCDKHQLHILLALTYDNLGQTTKALDEWELCVAFADKNFPPADENKISLCVQAALCAQAAGKESKAKEFASAALQDHDLLFGGGVRFFRERFKNEVKLELRPSSTAKNVLTGSAALNALWPNN